MSGFYSGQHGAFYLDGVKVAAVKGWSFSTTSAVLATTTLGDVDASAIYGVRTTTGTASLFFYRDSAGKSNHGFVNLLVKANGEAPVTGEIRLFWGEGPDEHAIKGEALVTNATMTCSTGEVLSSNVTFQFTGAMTEAAIL